MGGGGGGGERCHRVVEFCNILKNSVPYLDPRKTMIVDVILL